MAVTFTILSLAYLFIVSRAIKAASTTLVDKGTGPITMELGSIIIALGLPFVCVGILIDKILKN